MFAGVKSASATGLIAKLPHSLGPNRSSFPPTSAWRPDKKRTRASSTSSPRPIVLPIESATNGSMASDASTPRASGSICSGFDGSVRNFGAVVAIAEPLRIPTCPGAKVQAPLVLSCRPADALLTPTRSPIWNEMGIGVPGTKVVMVSGVNSLNLFDAAPPTKTEATGFTLKLGVNRSVLARRLNSSTCSEPET